MLQLANDEGLVDDVMIISACDEGYFPLVKGLFLSIIAGSNVPANIRLGFVDVGCGDASLEWLRSRGVVIRQPDVSTMGDLADVRFGIRRAQTCRPFLPRRFPGAKCVAGRGADVWVRGGGGFGELLIAGKKKQDRVFASPEFHFTYTWVMEIEGRSKEVANLNRAFFGDDAAREMARRPVYNSGFILASANHPIWRNWGTFVEGIYLDESAQHPQTAIHFAEQVAFNRSIRELETIEPLDPLYNYLCLWTPPFRDASGIVRLSASPYLPVGALHLAGGWRFFGRKYLQARLLFDEGRYLSANELNSLTATANLDRYTAGVKAIRRATAEA